MIDLSKLSGLLGSLPIQLPNGWTATQLANGGWTLTPPAAGSAAMPAAAGQAQDPVAALAPLLEQGATAAIGNPLGGIAVGALFAVGKAIHDRLAAAGPAGSNPTMQEASQDFWSIVTHAFPLPGLTPPAPPMAG